MVQNRGLPRAIAARGSGQLGLRYEEPRPCASGGGNCPTLVDYLFNANGTFSHEEVVGPVQPASAPPKPGRPAPKPNDDMQGDD
jgi:hypothetical protein